MGRTAKHPNQAIEFLGGSTAVAEMLGISRAAITQWRGVIPAERVIQLAEMTGIPAEYFWRPHAFEVRPRKEWVITKKTRCSDSASFTSF